MYVDGKGVPRDDAEADRWWRKAAEHGYAKAQFDLGSMYTLGQGVPRDYVQAYMWLNLAASGGADKAAQVRDALEHSMTAEQIAEAQQRTAAWRPSGLDFSRLQPVGPQPQEQATEHLVPYADFETGNSLKEKCGRPLGALMEAVCEGYIIGVASVIGSPFGSPRPCFPDHVTVGQVVDIARQYLAQNPAERHLPARFIVARALSQAFPCAK